MGECERVTRGTRRPSFPRKWESIFTAHTLDSGLRRNDDREAGRAIFNPLCGLSQAMVIPAQSLPRTRYGVAKRNGAGIQRCIHSIRLLADNPRHPIPTFPRQRDLCITLATARKSPLPRRERVRVRVNLSQKGEIATVLAHSCFGVAAIWRKTSKNPLTPALSPRRGSKTCASGHSYVKVSPSRGKVLCKACPVFRHCVSTRYGGLLGGTAW